MQVVARISSIECSETEDLDAWVCPSAAASILLRLTVGPAGVDGGDLFDVSVCNAAWLADRADDRPLGLRHHILVSPGTSFDAVRRYLETRVHACSDTTWSAVAERVGRFAAWEFEDYR